jgi:hypothetical protein
LLTLVLSSGFGGKGGVRGAFADNIFAKFRFIIDEFS